MFAKQTDIFEKRLKYLSGLLDIKQQLSIQYNITQ